MVEWGGLENRCTLTGTVGSNPTPSELIIHRTVKPIYSKHGRLLQDQTSFAASFSRVFI